MSSRALPRASPAETGCDPAAITEFLDRAAELELELHGFMLFHGGAVIAEGWWRPYRADLPHMQHSLAKSVTATAIGCAVAEGRIRLDDQVLPYFADKWPPQISDNLAVMTIRDLLSMRTGHRTGISGAAWRAGVTDWAAAFLAEDVPEQPGSRFVYNSGASYMLSAILQRATGERLSDYLRPRVFEPLGLAQIDWDICPAGVNPGGNGLSWCTEASLRLGILHAQAGRWEGRQVLPEGWVRQATQTVTSCARSEPPGSTRHLALAAPARGYGLHWWTLPGGGFLASGLFGQFAVVLPAEQAVIAVTAAMQPRDDRLLDLIWHTLRPGLQSISPHQRDPAGLVHRLDSMALTERAPTPRSALVSGVSGRRYVIAPNPLGVAAVTLRFEGAQGSFVLEDGSGTHTVAFGLDTPMDGVTTMPGASLHHGYEPGDMRVLAFGRWVTDEQFEMTWRFIETAFGDVVQCVFSGDTVTIQRRVNVNIAATEWPMMTGTQTDR